MNKIRTGILGCGRIALATHIPILRARPDIEIVALADPDEARRNAALAQVPGAMPVSDWRDVVKNPDVDAVVIALPSGLHAEAAVAALAAGKHIYLEKPIATTLADGHRVIEAWKASNRVAFTGFNYRFHPLISALRQQIQSRRIGPVIAARASFTTPDGDLPDWKKSRSSGGGVLLDLALHHVDLLRYVLAAEVETVNARITSVNSEADTATLDLQLTGNIPAQLLVSFRGIDENRIEIFGRYRKLAVDCYRSAEVEYSAPGQNGAASLMFGVVRAVASKFSENNMSRSYRSALEAFVSAVASQKQPECYLNAGLASLKVIDAAERSAESGSIVTLDQPAAAPPIQCDSSQPSLTVIAVTMDSYRTLRRTVQHLAAQTIHPRIELLLCSPSRETLQLDESDMRPFHSFRILETARSGDSVAAKLEAVQTARAPLVVFAEDHSFPEPTWAEELVAAHAQGAAAAAPQMRNANPTTMASWAGLFLSFGPWVEPRPHGPIGGLPWHNSAYDRATLLSFGDELEVLLENEGLLHERLRAQGKQLYLLQARTRHVNITLPRSFCREHYHGGRSFGGGRARAGRWSLARRLIHVAAAPLIPVLRLRSTLNDVKQCGRRELLPAMLPSLLLGLYCHALGEAAGIAWGAGASSTRKSDLEFHRERHISDADAAELGMPQSA